MEGMWAPAADGASLLIVLMAAQFGVHAAGWAMTAAMQRRAGGTETHFAVFWLALAAALAQRALGGPGAPEFAAEAALLLAALALHRGLVLFYRREPQDKVYTAVLGVTAAVFAVAAFEGWREWAVATVSLAVAGWLGAAARLFAVDGRHRARWLSTSLAVALASVALLFVLRAGVVLRAEAAAPMPWRTVDLACGVGVFLLGGFFNLGQIRLVVGRVVRQLVAESHRDPLTRVANRRGFMSLLNAVHRRARAVGATYGLLMVDIDHFKRVNDEQGHAAGDAALKRVAGVLRAAVRSRDIIGRLGGEEFCVLLPGCDLPGATGLAERLCRAVAARCELTVSVGVALVEPETEAPESALARADHALYEAKNAGRDRVALAEPLRVRRVA